MTKYHFSDGAKKMIGDSISMGLSTVWLRIIDTPILTDDGERAGWVVVDADFDRASRSTVRPNPSAIGSAIRFISERIDDLPAVADMSICSLRAGSEMRLIQWHDRNFRPQRAVWNIVSGHISA